MVTRSSSLALCSLSRLLDCGRLDSQGVSYLSICLLATGAEVGEAGVEYISFCLREDGGGKIK